MANAPPPRPQPFPTGMELSKHYRVEALVRLSEGRMYYLVTDDRPLLGVWQRAEPPRRHELRELQRGL
jgi:hypothetical protein